jgi:hypothetical protein
MRSVIAAAVLLLALTGMPAGAQSSFDAAGTICAQFLRARARDSVHRQTLNWLYGYASGLSAGLNASKHLPGVPLTNDQLLKSTADYCQTNPGATIADAASAWVPQSLPEPEPPPNRGLLLDLDKRPSNPGGRR